MENKQTRIEIFASFQTKQIPGSRAERGRESRRVQGQFLVSGHLDSLSLQEMTTVHFRALISSWESRSITPAPEMGVIIQEVAWPDGQRCLNPSRNLRGFGTWRDSFPSSGLCSQSIRRGVYLNHSTPPNSCKSNQEAEPSSVLGT